MVAEKEKSKKEVVWLRLELPDLRAEFDSLYFFILAS